MESRAAATVPQAGSCSTNGATSASPNATTAWSKTSTGLPIAVTLCIDRRRAPPALSHFSVYCPALEPETEVEAAPRVISADSDLVLFRIPNEPMGIVSPRYNDYFVYRMNPQQPKLDLIPNPHDRLSPELFADQEIAILSCDDDKYIVAALKITLRDHTFKLHLYRSTTHGGKRGGSWTSQLVSVEEPLREKVIPIPESVENQMFHMTTKAGSIFGEASSSATCSLRPKVRDMPLPLPAKGNWTKIRNCCPYCCRDITVNQRRDTIKYIEMEITPPSKLISTPSRPVPVPDSYYEWARPRQRSPPRSTCTLLPGSWRATTWSMPIPVASWSDWHRDCFVRSANLNLPVDDPKHSKLLHKLMASSDCNEPEARELTCPWDVCASFPTLSIADDEVVVYLLSKGMRTGSREVMVAVDVRTRAIRGVAKLDTKRHVDFTRCCLAIGIPKHLKTKTGTKASLEQAKEHIVEGGMGSKSLATKIRV
ncbi:hypothetical protein E2562_029214 [Oryza meyeriana var. granulata]|uniref:DUF1618 domain-containing protein n=1 Tax=Oryza meyeriana var. granulata TaxID=110450 RepID=A0A6G1EQT9_9ORYZ|nr:hypothetical protein E2562_029214 [Oryza meyeriana var. granulata]